MGDPFERVGLELELLAPNGVFRNDVAIELAGCLGGRCEFGFKYHGENEQTDGRTVFRLSDAVRVRDAADQVQVTLVPDNTLRDGLETSNSAWVMLTDDLRLALWVEDQCWSSDEDPLQRLSALQSVFGGLTIDGAIADKYGHALVTPSHEPVSWRRICEFVTRPLSRAEREEVVTTLLKCANACGLTIATTSALHAHYDASPWQHIGVLRHFLIESHAQFETWRKRLKPNLNCLRLGRQPQGVIDVARAYPSGDDDFFAFGAALALAGAAKSSDFNVTGVIRRFPKQPTFEVRCLPMALDAASLLASLEQAESVLRPFLTG